MNALAANVARLPGHLPDEEWALRLDLAACYRLFDFFGWSEAIFNHITVRVPGGDRENPHYLINPYGLHYSEVTASNLVKIDGAGNRVDASSHPVNPAGFIIHSAIHTARPDAHCVMHTHTTAGVAVACKESGLRHDNFYSAMFYENVAYHDFEGITTNAGECPRLVASLGAKNVLILRNHGLLVCGPTLAHTLQTLWFLQRACEIQVASDSLQGPNLSIGLDVLRSNQEQFKPMDVGRPTGELMFEAMLRRAGIRRENLA